MVANADESEPGTFKDREIMESNPFQFLEGRDDRILRGRARRPPTSTCAASSGRSPHRSTQKIAEMERAGLLGEKLFGGEYGLKIYTHLGAGAYICGEETALLESHGGQARQPRIRPPFPAVHGLYGKPTVVNNVETLANLPMILANGADWFKTLGTPDSAGVKIFSPLWARPQARQLRAAFRHHLPPVDLRAWRGRAGRAPGQGDHGRRRILLLHPGG